MRLSKIEKQVKDCTKCELYKNRTNYVLGEGDKNADVMFIGEAPGKNEDETGKPFVGKAGKQLTKILSSVNIDREDIYISNIIKDQPPDNRNPKKEEMNACFPYLEAQIATINPKLIVTLGAVPTQYILNTDERISDLRGKFYDWRDIKVFPMFHPSYLLHKPETGKGTPKYKTWQDIKKINEKL